ncbi:MAG: hypothetical protein EA387_03635 [Nitriliruptor sp.]|nr:MAG: hypothetical protein EA387_03635 [Nitriliruptor sp.]
MLVLHAAWVLVVAMVISLVYEIWRATSKAGTSRHDSMQNLWGGLALYGIAAAVIAVLFVGPAWAAWLGLLFCVAWIAYGIFVFNPVVMLERKPGIIDWVEDLVFMGLLFVAAALLLYEVLGWELQR